MANHEFERNTISHPIYHVSELSIDLLRGRVFMALVFDRDLDIAKVAVEFSFLDCNALTVLRFDEPFDKQPLSHLLGILSESVDFGTKYIITCGIAEVSFISSREPEINWYDKSSLEMPYYSEQIIRQSKLDDRKETTSI